MLRAAHYAITLVAIYPCNTRMSLRVGNHPATVESRSYLHSRLSTSWFSINEFFVRGHLGVSRTFTSVLKPDKVRTRELHARWPPGACSVDERSQRLNFSALNAPSRIYAPLQPWSVPEINRQNRGYYYTEGPLAHLGFSELLNMRLPLGFWPVLCPPASDDILVFPG